ncbi:TPA: hypothetical protein ACKQDH_003342 [Pseudomonas aeruginosa]
MVKDYIGFYSNNGFWVDRRYDWGNNLDRSKLEGIIQHQAIWHHCPEFSAAVCVDGMILLRVERLFEVVPSMSNPDEILAAFHWWDDHLDYANALQLCIVSEALRCSNSSNIDAMEITVESTCRVGFSGGRAVRSKFSECVSFMSARRRMYLGLTQNADEMGDVLSTFSVVSEESLYKAFCLFEAVCHNPVHVGWLSFLARAGYAFRKNDFRAALVFIWFVIESIVKELWGGGRFYSKFPSSAVVLRELMRNEVISDRLYHALDFVRARRNSLMHEPIETTIFPDDCLKAADSALELFSLIGNDRGLVLGWKCGVEF